MESPILQGLNPAQRAAVEAYDSASLIIAGAGSGKTRVLTSRIAYMIQKGIKPKNILATTFTNKAAQEMRERIVKMIPEYLTEGQARHIWMGTFHSIFARILRTDAERIGFPTNFTIYDASDARNLIKTIVKELNLADDKYKPNVIASRISQAKNALVTPGAYLANSAHATEDRRAQIPEFGNIYNLYCQRCKHNGAMDFDDLLLQTNILLRDCPDVLEYYQKQFKYILVDEYQDRINFSVSSAACRSITARSASWATTHSRSTRSAAPRSKTSSPSSATIPKRKSSSWNRTTVRRARSSRRPTR